MLNVLRSNLKYLSWILWVVILVFVVFVFVDFGGGLGGGQQGRATAAARVGDAAISQKEFEREYRRLEGQYRQAFGGQWNSELADRMQLPQQALQRLVDRELIANEARGAGLAVSDEDVRLAILEFPALQSVQGQFVGQEEYQRFLRAYGYTAREFEELVREDLLVQRFSALLESGVAIDDAQIERAWRDRNERAEIRYLLAPAARHQGQTQLDAAAVAAYFERHRDDFRLPDQRVVDYLLVDEANLRAGIALDRAEIERAYAERRAEFEQPEQVRARHILIKIDDNRDAAAARAVMSSIRARLAKGESFEKLAAELSEDPGSKQRGGDLGAFGRGQMVPAFEEAAFGARAGEIVGPVETSFGLHLIEVLERTSGRTQALAEVEGRLRSELVASRASELAETRAKQLATRIGREKPADEAAWKALADGSSVELLTTPAFGQEEPVPGIGRNPEFAATAFGLDTGAHSQPVRVARGWAILRFKEAKPARSPELAEVEARVRAAAERERAGQLAAAELERAKAMLAGGRKLDEVATGLGLELQESGEFGREGTIQGLGAAEAVAEAAMTLAVGAVGGPVVVPQGAVLFEVTSRTAFDASRFASERAALRDELRGAEANKLLATWLAKRRDEVGVTYDPQLAERLGLTGRAG
jgi:peptidyl-prolyl cis-trans isomerase D